MSAVETAQPYNFSLCLEMKPWARYLWSPAEVSVKGWRQISMEMTQKLDWLHAGRQKLSGAQEKAGSASAC